nr:PREDICTED: ubiquitin carboxyl-terminal hydrolase 26 isoform X2 [Daucus carota subsp. sativus]
MTNRPATRSKNKRQKVDDDAAVTSRLFRQIHSSGQVTADDINHLYMISKPVCQGCRLNTKDNPNCFCGLIPPPNGSRKSGLWQKTSDILDSLGADPSNDLRASLESPAGLTNLGATCYANSILQCLYMNKLFREGIFCVEQDVLKQQPVIDQLARLFAKLHASKMSFIDSAPFIRTLELDNGVQQDSHEFLTLLFSLLEQCLSCSTVARARTVVQDLFRGGVSHVTKCSQCGNESAASSKIEDFYELELNVKGLKSLDESLNDYLSVEELREDNQYYCESCAARVDASRSIKLRSLPTVLNFQLKRCIFLPNTTKKKKITSVFGFPRELDMSDRLTGHSQGKWLYDLSAVLIHKGSAVNSGHYVAHIKDENTEQWWEFDDEQVSSLGQHPFGEESSKSVPKPSSIEPVVQATCSKTTDGVANGSHADTGEPLSSASNNATDAQMFSSTEAYMLTYILRRPKNDGEYTQLGSGEASLEKGSSISIPSHLYEEVSKLNESLSDSCEQYKLKKKSEMDQITEKREEVRSVLCAAAVQSSQEPYFWISADWLRHWADNITSPTIDNSPITCLHGKLPVSKVGQAKRLSTNSWTMLFSKYGGGPILAKDDYCTDCVLEEARGLVCADSYRDQRMLMREIAEAALSGMLPDGKSYYVSKTWLQQWLRRKTLDAPCEADSGPTASIRCPHGELLPEKAAGARRLLIPETLWLFIVESANTVKPNDLEGCSVFLLESEPCGICSTNLSEEACEEDSMREFKLKQRQSHEKLAQGKSVTLSSNSKYYLIPSSWLSNWRSFISTSGKNASPPPETLNSVLELLKCEQHSRLLKRPPQLTWRRGAIFQKSPTLDELAIITENDWKVFCEDWGGIDSGGVSAIIEFNIRMEGNALGLSKDTPLSEEHSKDTPLSEEHMDSATAYDDSECGDPILKTSPMVCEDCIGERESSELMKKLNYYNEDIRVCLVRGKEPPKSILSASEKSLELNRRTSKRSRKTTFGNTSNFKVSGSTTIYQLKMMIWESFGIVKENQILHKGPKIIDMETATLSDMNIFPGDLLWVKDSEIHENRDIADELSACDQKMEIQQTEEGFRGTLLTSNISSQIMGMF